MLILLLLGLTVQYYVPVYDCLSITGCGEDLYVLTDYGIAHFKKEKYIEGIAKDKNFYGAELILCQAYRGIWLLRQDSLFIYNPFLQVETFMYVLPFKPTSFSINRNNVFLEKNRKVYLFDPIRSTTEEKGCVECKWTGKLSLKELKKEGIPSKIIDDYGKIYNITSLYADYQNVWAGTNGSGILRYSIFNRIPDTIQIGAYDVNKIIERAGYLIFLGESEIFTLKQRRWQRHKNTSTLPIELSSLAVDINRGEIKKTGIDSIYIGKTLFKIKKNYLHLTSSKEEKKIKGIKKIFSDGNSIVLLGMNGIYEYKDRLIKIDFPFLPEVVNFCFIAEKTFFFGTKKGIVKIKKNKVIRIYNINDGLPSNNILSIFVKNNRIWFSSDKGVGYIEE